MVLTMDGKNLFIILSKIEKGYPFLIKKSHFEKNFFFFPNFVKKILYI